ncbi:MAG: hypothetical protein D6729_05030 [Deltaproteobacteria bacterium]|nr:MAG: hypothetical protein D6729_05030 [Deltaproteobacteria bacterium]
MQVEATVEGGRFVSDRGTAEYGTVSAGGWVRPLGPLTVQLRVPLACNVLGGCGLADLGGGLGLRTHLAEGRLFLAAALVAGIPTGSEALGVGTGHLELVPTTEATWHLDRSWSLGAVASLNLAVGGHDHAHADGHGHGGEGDEAGAHLHSHAHGEAADATHPPNPWPHGSEEVAGELHATGHSGPWALRLSTRVYLPLSDDGPGPLLQARIEASRALSGGLRIAVSLAFPIAGTPRQDLVAGLRFSYTTDFGGAR